MSDIKLINGKFQDVVNDISDDTIIISDPPYNINFDYNEYNDNMSDEDYTKMIAEFKGKKVVLIHYPEEFMKYYVPALGVPDEVVTWCYNSNLPGRHSRLIGFWNCKPDLKADYQPYKNPNDKRIKERIAKGSKGARLYDWWSDINLTKNVTKDKDGNPHPCPIPLKLCERLIKVTHATKVFDPFTGSGTMAEAALNLDVDFIGTELDKKYYDYAVERIEKLK